MNSKGNHAVFTFSREAAPVKAWIQARAPLLHVMSAGQRIELYKDIGSPAQVAARYQFGQLKGSHLVGHTRMATESAVTPDRAHPFTAGEDFCLVHNGSLSNPNAVRHLLQPRGIHFDTDNDTEAACRFLNGGCARATTCARSTRRCTRLPQPCKACGSACATPTARTTWP